MDRLAESAVNARKAATTRPRVLPKVFLEVVGDAKAIISGSKIDPSIWLRADAPRLERSKANLLQR